MWGSAPLLWRRPSIWRPLRWRSLNLAPLTVAIPVVILAAVLLLRIRGNSRIKGDAAIALISTSSLAVGVMVISMTTGMNTDVYNYMFGSILAMSDEDVVLSVVMAVIVLALFVFFYHKIFGSFTTRSLPLHLTRHSPGRQG